jgi:hypothetical protein
MQVITQTQAADMIRKSNGKLFSVTFIKRSNGARRRMVARVGVTKGVTGDGKKFNERDHDLVTVHEFVTSPHTVRGDKGRFAGGGNLATQWRHVSIEGIRELRMGRKTYAVEGY